MATSELRGLPSVERLASDDRLAGHDVPGAARSAAREILESERAALKSGGEASGYDALVTRTGALLDSWTQPGPQPVINATGVILHTNLGRAPLPVAAREALLTAAGYCSVELDLRSGARSSRQDHLRPLLRAVSGAGDGMVVTNNAAAILLVLRALCHRREVLVSRGEAVAIGDGFRIPTIAAESGTRLVDVGTTNRTTVADYEAAITPRTAAILRVHPSNFTVEGFTERPTIAECAELAHRHGILLIDDVGSGWMERPADLAATTGAEPLVRDVLEDGADVVMCSGDKLCGGPQAGLIFAGRDITEKLRRHPLARALRPDKLIVAALAATLAVYMRGAAREELPVLRMLAMPAAETSRRAHQWCDTLRLAGVPATESEGRSQVGGGALPGAVLAGVCVTVADPRGALYRALLEQRPAVMARVTRGRLWLDPRTVDPVDDFRLVEAVIGAYEAAQAAPGKPAT